MEIRREGSVEAVIDAGPGTVYDVISDVARTGEWSPECRGCEWVDHRRGVGARFKGRNRSGVVRWSRLVEVVAADPGREFAFRTVTDRLNKDSTTWRFRLTPDGAGTRVHHSYEIHELPAFPVSWIMALLLRHHADMRPQMAESLEALKALTEAEATIATNESAG